MGAFPAVRGVRFAVVLALTAWALPARAEELAAELARIRNEPALAYDNAAIDALVLRADSAPESVTRTEIWSMAGEAYAERLHRPGDAARQWEKILADPSSDPILAQKAARDLGLFRVRMGELDGARALAAREPSLAREIGRAERRRAIHRASLAVLGIVVVAAGVAIARRREALVPVKRMALFAVAYGVYVATFGALLASGYEAKSARPFLLFGAALPPLLLLVRGWAAAGSSSRGARVGRALLAAASVIAVAFLVLETVDVAYLAGFGL